MLRIIFRFLLCIVGSGFAPATSLAIQTDGMTSRFIFEKSTFAQCHASTIAESNDSLVAAWFGGEYEKHPSVGIWLSRFEDTQWTDPVEVANGNQTEGPVERFPCWNPVLFQPENGPLLLFYKVGPDPSHWWGMLKTSDDGGKNWSAAQQLPEGIAGPIKNKPIELKDGIILCGASSEDNGWRVHFEATPDNGANWWRTPPVNDGQAFSIIQPAFLHNGMTIHALCRSKQQRIIQVSSNDNGWTWSKPKTTDLPNPNSGFDAVTLTDGRHLLVYNHITSGRSPLNLALSNDGEHWTKTTTLEDRPAEFSYPAIIQTKDGNVHITYTWKRERIKHVVIDLSKISLPGESSSGNE